ncbi:MAG: hypothetical protein VX874_16705 [Pseudomonadota bacterium]|nr:hypothetical protein [Pseudomonadota bacterium]
MMDAQGSSRTNKFDRLPFLVGGLLTLAIGFFFLSALVFWPPSNDTHPNKLGNLIHAPPNELGDFVGGIASTLAFVWIIVTVWLQSRELAAQRQQLELNRVELGETRRATEEMAKAQSEQVKILQRQGDIFEHELRGLIETDAGLEFEQLLVSFSRFLRNFPEPKWEYIKTRKNGGSSKGSLQIAGNYLIEDREPEQQILLLHSLVTHNKHQLDEFIHNGWISLHPKKFEFPALLLDKLNEVLELENRLSSAQRIKLRDLKLAETRDTLLAIKNGDYWMEEETDI